MRLVVSSSRATVTAAVCCVLVITSCSGSGSASSSEPEETVRTEPSASTTATDDPTPTESAPSMSAESPGSNERSGAPGTSADTDTTTPPSEVEIEISFASSCVRPGSSQTIAIQTLPGSGVVYDAVYADGRSGIDPDHYGGNQGGRTDASGEWEDTFVIGVGAPPGPVHVAVMAATPRGNARAAGEFAVADVNGRCP